MALAVFHQQSPWQIEPKVQNPKTNPSGDLVPQFEVVDPMPSGSELSADSFQRLYRHAIRWCKVFSYYTKIMREEPFEEIEHTADWALIVRGPSLNSLFEHAAQGMFSLLAPRFDDEAGRERSLELDEIDLETLLVSWLEELLYQIESEGMGAADFRVEILDSSLEATFTALPIQSIKKDIKAVTYNELEIVHDAGGFRTTIVFDV
jgi:SHS2 domain-containing protein